MEPLESSTAFECSDDVGTRTLELGASCWHFPTAPVGQSNLPLLGESDTGDLQRKIKASVWPNRLRHLIKLPGTTDNLNRKLGSRRQLHIEDCLALLLARGVASEDLHKPLARSARADGKLYSAE